MAVVVLDASVLVAYLKVSDSLHSRAVLAMATHQYDELVLPSSAYAEALVGVYHVGPSGVATVEQCLQAFAMRVEALTSEIAHRAAWLRSQRLSLRLPDAFVLATGDILNAALVLTGDAAWPRISPRARLI